MNKEAVIQILININNNNNKASLDEVVIYR